ncbi:MAG: hypothetical protein ABW148_10325 [Sedimenticola sp.]
MPFQVAVQTEKNICLQTDFIRSFDTSNKNEMNLLRHGGFSHQAECYSHALLVSHKLRKDIYLDKTSRAACRTDIETDKFDTFSSTPVVTNEYGDVMASFRNIDIIVDWMADDYFDEVLNHIFKN